VQTCALPIWIRDEIETIGVGLRRPGAREIRLAVRRAARWSRQVRTAVGGPRNAGGAKVEPLREQRARRQRQGHNQYDPLHHALLLLYYWRSQVRRTARRSVRSSGVRTNRSSLGNS